MTAPPMTPTLPTPPAARLPDGFAVRLAADVQRRDGGTTLLGGSPLRLMRLAARARPLLAGDRLVVRDRTTAELAARLLDAGMAAPDLPARPTADVTVVIPGRDRTAAPRRPPAAPRARPARRPAAVTVVIPVRDRTAALRRLLAALRADPATAGVPVLVVDDGSADPAGVAAAAHAAAARVLRHDAARGPAAARNAGLGAATTGA